MPKKLLLSLSRKPVMTLGRAALGADRLVYIVAANKPITYPRGRSRIVHIGTTKRGVRRIASSVAHRAEELFSRPGVRTADTHLLTYARRVGPQKVWLKLQRAMLFMFQSECGNIPILNRIGRHIWPGPEFDYFSRRSLLKRIREFERNSE
jgi:hypothetical protein